jgi:hypothetical protein
MAIILTSSTSLAFSGTMGEIVSPATNLLIEAGGSYTHFFYKSNVASPESRSLDNPNGYNYNPGDYHPNDFGGGYLGLSLYRNSWLMNIRYDMFALKGKRNSLARTYSRIAPEKLSFTLDKTWQATMPFVYGFGGGVTMTTYNQAQIFYSSAQGDGSVARSFHGRTRLAPLVEVLAMYQVAENVNLKANLAYQIPVTEVYYNGALTANLGINYSVPL